eukprot:1946206-Amphidinium_carterae.1
MTKYLETAKIKKHSETLGLHPYLGNRSINMITRGQLRPRGSYATRPRGTTPQPRQRLRVYPEENRDDYDFFQPKIEDMDEKRQRENMTSTTTMRMRMRQITRMSLASANYSSTADNF